MTKDHQLNATLDGLEIGAIGPNSLQLVLFADKVSINLQMSSDDARMLASALNYWAEQSASLQLN